MIPLEQIGRTEVRMEEPLMKRRDRTPTITVRSDIDERLQPSDVAAEIQKALQPIVAKLPAGYRIETEGRSRSRPRPTQRSPRSSRSCSC